MATASIAGSDLYYYESGEGPAILFIHGLLTDADTWRDQLTSLSSEFRCVAFDRRGNSRSPMGGVDFPSPELHALDAAELIDELGLRPCLLVASSMGGVVAIELMRRTPELVRGAVLSEPAIFSLDPVGGPALVRSISVNVQRALDTSGFRAASAVFSRILDGRAWEIATREERARITANVPVLLRVLQRDEYHIETEELSRIQVPCLVIQGDDSPRAFGSIARRLSGLLPDSALVTLANCGHLTYLHQPENFSALVREFSENLV